VNNAGFLSFTSSICLFFSKPSPYKQDQEGFSLPSAFKREGPPTGRTTAPVGAVVASIAQRYLLRGLRGHPDPYAALCGGIFAAFAVRKERGIEKERV